MCTSTVVFSVNSFANIKPVRKGLSRSFISGRFEKGWAGRFIFEFEKGMQVEAGQPQRRETTNKDARRGRDYSGI